MENKKPTKYELELTAKLAESMLDYLYFKIIPILDPIPVKEWAETQGQRHESESNKWRFQVIDSDLGKTEVSQTDRFGWDILKMSREIIYKAYRNLTGDSASQEAIDYIFGNEDRWSKKLEELQK